MSEGLLVGLVAIALTAPANAAVRLVLKAARGVEPAGPGAGRWIGSLERLLIYTLVVAGDPAAAGLVVAAKSILRYPEISGDHPSMNPEYVLIGSLASWLLAFVAGELVTVVIG